MDASVIGKGLDQIKRLFLIEFTKFKDIFNLMGWEAINPIGISKKHGKLQNQDPMLLKESLSQWNGHLLEINGNERFNDRGLYNVHF